MAERLRGRLPEDPQAPQYQETEEAEAPPRQRGGGERLGRPQQAAADVGLEGQSITITLPLSALRSILQLLVQPPQQ